MKKPIKHQRIKLCFVSLNSYPLLIEKNLGYTGGAEIQQVELARELHKRRYQVSFITYGKSSNVTETVNGIEIVPVYDRAKVNNLSFISKVLRIWKKMKQVDADVYFNRAGSPGITSIIGRFRQKKIINLIASDAQVTGKIITQTDKIKGFLEKIGNWFDIKLSDVVVLQSNFQEAKLKKRFKVDGLIIKNAFKIPLECKTEYITDTLLWVGSIKSVKQPHLVLEIAKHFPDHNFLMIGGSGESPESFRKIKNAANSIQNLNFIGFVARDKIFDYYKKAILLVNTSSMEGFPNVFLEAWMHSIPVVSLNVDPDGIITKHKLGYHSKTFEQMINDIRTLLTDKRLRDTMGENGRKYVEKNHDIKKIADQYENIIKNLLGNKFQIRK